MNREIQVRLDRLTARMNMGREVEDIRAVDVSIYGEAAVRKIYQEEGPESLRELLTSPDMSDDEKEMIAGFLRRKGHTARLRK